MLTAFNFALAPTIARLYATGEIARLQRVITRSAQVILLLSAPPAILLATFSGWFMGLVGQEFVSGLPALIILSGAQLVNAAAGSVGLTLMMTGHERSTAYGLFVSAVVNVVLNAVLIPQFASWAPRSPPRLARPLERATDHRGRPKPRHRFDCVWSGPAMAEMRYPDFCIVGAPKCGTTGMYASLSAPAVVHAGSQGAAVLRQRPGVPSEATSRQERLPRDVPQRPTGTAHRRGFRLVPRLSEGCPRDQERPS